MARLGLAVAASLALFAGIWLRPGHAATVTQTFTSVADAYIAQKSPSSNYGAKTSLQADGSPIVRAYIRFDVQGVIGPVSRATLRLYPTSSSSTGFTVRGSTNSWTESTITYGNAPVPSSTTAGGSGAFGARAWISVDVTSLVTGNGSFSVALSTTTSTSMALASREYGTSFAPQLVVESTSVAPTSTAPPAISGAAQDGRTLTADPGTWSGTQPIALAYQWRRCDVAGGGCADLAGAAQKTYTVGAADVGSTFRVRVTASNSAGSTTATSAATATAGAALPANVGLPAIAGMPAEGETLSANPGTWSGTQPLAYTYQWRRCDAGGGSCADLDGATQQTYTLAAADVGATLRVAVTASNAAGSATATSAQTSAVSGVVVPSPPLSLAAPTISGTAQENGVLTVDPGTWSGTTPITYAYQWRRCDSSGAGCGDVAGATGTTYALGAADVGSTLRVAVTASNADGSATANAAPTGVIGPAPIAAADPVVAAAGDIACPSPAVSSGSSCHFGLTADAIAGDPAVTQVLTLGDNQYDCGDLQNFLSFFDPTWGRFKAKTRPAIGNHEYYVAPTNTACNSATTTPAAGYFDYWNGAGLASGAAGERSKGYYSFDVGTWHLIALNSNCSQVGGCGAGSPQETWLRSDLASTPSSCVLAYWHHPLFSSGEHGNNTSVKPLYQALYDSGAELVLNGHDHHYERFAPQSPAGAVDLAHGIREFVVGTGGKSHYGYTTVQPNSEVRNATTFGVLKLTLHGGGYDWSFVPEAGASFSDSGSGSCHGANTDTTPPAPPTNLAATAASPARIDLSWSPSGASDVAGYKIFRDGTALTTTSATTYADASVQPATTHSYYVVAYDTAGNTSTTSNTLSATTPADVTPPTPPTSLSATAAGANQVKLAWATSADDVGVTGYRIYRDGAQLGTTSTPAYVDASVQPGGSYSYFVLAYDGAANASQPSNTATVTTSSTAFVFSAAADAYVQSDTPTTNYGASSQVIADNSPVKRMLLKFVVAGIGAGQVASAKLRLYCVDPGPVGGDFRRVSDSSWIESSVTWNTAPAADAVSLGTLGAVAAGTWYELDVTPLVTGDGAVAVEASSSSSDGAHYASKENTTGNAPQLVVTLK